MTVKELRDILAQFDDDIEIMVINEEGNFRSIEEINKGYHCIKGDVIVID